MGVTANFERKAMNYTIATSLNDVTVASAESAAATAEFEIATGAAGVLIVRNPMSNEERAALIARLSNLVNSATQLPGV